MTHFVKKGSLCVSLAFFFFFHLFAVIFVVCLFGGRVLRREGSRNFFVLLAELRLGNYDIRMLVGLVHQQKERLKEQKRRKLQEAADPVAERSGGNPQVSGEGKPRMPPVWSPK